MILLCLLWFIVYFYNCDFMFTVCNVYKTFDLGIECTSKWTGSIIRIFAPFLHSVSALLCSATQPQQVSDLIDGCSFIIDDVYVEEITPIVETVKFMFLVIPCLIENEKKIFELLVFNRTEGIREKRSIFLKKKAYRYQYDGKIHIYITSNQIIIKKILKKKNIIKIRFFFCKNFLYCKVLSVGSNCSYHFKRLSFLKYLKINDFNVKNRFIRENVTVCTVYKIIKHICVRNRCT